MDHLPCVLRIHGGPVASSTVPGGAIVSASSLRGIMEIGWSYGISKMGSAGAQAAGLKRRLRRERVNCVLANFGPSGVSLMQPCEQLGIPLIVHFHGYDAHRKEAVSKNADGYRRLGEKAAAIIAVSQGMLEALVDLGIPREKIHLLRCGVDTRHFSEKEGFPEVPLFFGVGRFVEKKAPYLTLVAFAKALTRLGRAKLVLAGTGELLEATRNLSVVLGIEDCVEFPGVLTPEEVGKLMKESTAFVQHSIEPQVGPSAGDREGTPVAVLEAMLTGVPVISTSHAGIGEVIENNRTGLLVNERDVEGMAEAMVRVGQSAELARSLGIAARVQALSNHTSEIYLDGLRRILGSCI
jgi:colanic acid/amylovoran biosynthesis glycosyltransferase